MTLTWVAIPVVWMLSYLGLISFFAEETAYEILDFRRAHPHTHTRMPARAHSHTH